MFLYRFRFEQNLVFIKYVGYQRYVGFKSECTLPYCSKIYFVASVAGDPSVDAYFVIQITKASSTDQRFDLPIYETEAPTK